MFPRKSFKESLDLFLRCSRHDGHYIVLDLDTDEYMCIENLARMLRSISLIDHIMTITSNNPPSSHNNGSKQIDGV